MDDDKSGSVDFEEFVANYFDFQIYTMERIHELEDLLKAFEKNKEAFELKKRE